MKTYDEVFENVMKATEAHHKKVRRIQNAVSVSALCAACAVGVGIFLKLEKPVSVPSDPDYSAMTMTTDEMTRMIDTTASAPASGNPAEMSNSTARVIESKTDSAAQNAVPAGEVVHSEAETTAVSAETGTHTHEIETTTVTTAGTEKSSTSTATEKTTLRTTATTAKETTHSSSKTETTVQTTVLVTETSTVHVTTEPPPPETEIIIITEEIIIPVTEPETEPPEPETEPEPVPVFIETTPPEPETEPAETESESETETETVPELLSDDDDEYLTPEEWEIRYGTETSDIPEPAETLSTITADAQDSDDNS